MLNLKPITLAILLALLGEAASAQSVTSEVFGLNQVRCRAGSDTVVSVPFQQKSVFQGKVGTTENPSPQACVIHPARPPGWTPNHLAGSHYVRMITGSRAGCWYEISGNTAEALTVDLKGLLAPAAGDQFVISPYWTLDTLFPAASQRAIYVSPGTLVFQQKTKILLPNLAERGVDLAAGDVCFLTSTGWKFSAAGFPAAGATVLPPGSSLIIRHPAGTSDTTFVPHGQVLMRAEVIALVADPEVAQDNDVAIFRPVPVLLPQSGLESAFEASMGHLAADRRDELRFIDLSATGYNRPANAVYYLVGATWYQDKGLNGANPEVTDSVVFQPSSATILRKAPAAGGGALWTNLPSYPQP